MDKSPVVLGIIGSGRSGSTLLERVLGSSPGIVNVGELVEVFRHLSENNRPCGCGTPFRECPFWAAVGSDAFGGWTDEVSRQMRELERMVARNRWVLTPERWLPPGFDRARTQYVAMYSRLYRAILRNSGADVVLDSSKWPAHMWALSGSEEIDVRVLHLIRDVRGVSYSWAKGGSRLAVYPVRETAVRWTSTQITAARVRREVKNSTVLRYEDFVESPRSQIAAMTDTLGVPWDGSAFVGEQVVRLGPSHGVAGNPVRAIHGDVTLRGDDDWRTRLPARDRLIATTIGAPMLLAHGYPLSSATKVAK